MYTVAESIEQLSAFIGHPGIEEIIKGLQEIASGRHDETAISDLRRALNAMLDNSENEAIMAGSISLVHEVSEALMLLAELFPLNWKDTFSQEPFTPEEIKNGGLIPTLTGHQFELAGLARWINKSKKYVNPFTGLTFHPHDQAAIYQKCATKCIALRLAPAAPAAWPKVVELLTDALREEIGIDDDDASEPLDYAAELEAIMRSIAGYNHLTVDEKELLSWQAAAWQVWSDVLEKAANCWQAAGVLAVAAARESAVSDQQRAVEQKTIALQAVVTLLTDLVQEATVDEQEDLESAISLLEVAMQKAATSPVAPAALEIAAATLEAAKQVAEREPLGQASPEQDQQLPPVPPQSDFFQPELPECRIIELSQESCAPWTPIIGGMIAHSKCVRAFDMRCFEGDCILSVYAGNSDSFTFPFASTPDRNQAFKNKLLEAGFREEGQSDISIMNFPSAGEQGSNAFVMKASVAVMNYKLWPMLNVIKKLEGHQVFTAATEEQILGSLQPLSSQNNPPVHGLM